MEIIDVRDWEKEDYVIGTRKKFLYTNPITRQSAFFKYPMEDERTDTQVIGEVWSEKVAADIGKIIGIPTPDVEIARNEDTFGSLSYKFVKETEEFLHGAELLSVYFQYQEKKQFDPHNLYHHKINYIVRTLKGFKNFEDELLSNFIEILVFDALIGNTDRHSENWGVVRNLENNIVKMAPAYDNSSSLGRELTEDKINHLIKDKKLFERYIFGKKAAACISIGDKKRTQHFELIEYIKANIHKPYTRKALKKVSLLTDSKIDTILQPIPSEIMNALTKKLVKKILVTRRDKLLEIRG